MLIFLLITLQCNVATQNTERNDKNIKLIIEQNKKESKYLLKNLK